VTCAHAGERELDRSLPRARGLRGHLCDSALGAGLAARLRVESRNGGTPLAAAEGAATTKVARSVQARNGPSRGLAAHLIRPERAASSAGSLRGGAKWNLFPPRRSRGSRTLHVPPSLPDWSRTALPTSAPIACPMWAGTRRPGSPLGSTSAGGGLQAVSELACEYISEPGVVRSSPVSSSVFRPERIIGQPP
jgi:hypothetical protein